MIMAVEKIRWLYFLREGHGHEKQELKYVTRRRAAVLLVSRKRN